MSIQLGLVQINVTNRNAAKRFYIGTLGLKERKRGFGPDGPISIDNGPGPEILIYQAPKRAHTGYPDRAGNYLVFYVSDLDATIKRWKKRGVKFVRISWSAEKSGVATCPYGRFIAFRDPDGNVHEVLEPRKR